jgi:predicted dithiol-disulfide oxidoreductase (DUF899 family)
MDGGSQSRQGDEIARRRQELPWVPVEKEYTFETEQGAKTLAPSTPTRSAARRAEARRARVGRSYSVAVFGVR